MKWLEIRIKAYKAYMLLLAVGSIVTALLAGVKWD